MLKFNNFQFWLIGSNMYWNHKGIFIKVSYHRNYKVLLKEIK